VVPLEISRLASPLEQRMQPPLQKHFNIESRPPFPFSPLSMLDSPTRSQKVHLFPMGLQLFVALPTFAASLSARMTMQSSRVSLLSNLPNTTFWNLGVLMASRSLSVGAAQGCLLGVHPHSWRSTFR
jgi:hypothetical protein